MQFAEVNSEFSIITHPSLSLAMQTIGTSSLFLLSVNFLVFPIPIFGSFAPIENP